MWARDFYRENTAENDTRSAHVLRTHGNQHQARGLPMAWNCVLGKMADTDRNSCMFAHIAKVMFLTKRKAPFEDDGGQWRWQWRFFTMCGVNSKGRRHKKNEGEKSQEEMGSGSSRMVCANLDHFGVLGEGSGHEKSRIARSSQPRCEILGTRNYRRGSQILQEKQHSELSKTFQGEKPGQQEGSRGLHQLCVAEWVLPRS